MLTIYTTPGCTDCASTCRALTRRGVPYRTVDLSTDPKALEHVRSLGYGLIPIEGVVAVWKSPALSSGLAIVDEVSEPTRGSYRGVRVIR
ncbi:glutaredoxin family protein [Streptomyces xinghaiensis]